MLGDDEKIRHPRLPAHVIHEKIAASDPLPSSYYLTNEGTVTYPKDQAAFPVCWAFASASAIESSILKHQKRTAGTLPAPQEHATPQLYGLPSKPDLSEHAPRLVTPSRPKR